MTGDQSVWRCASAEAIGTFALVFAGTGAIAVDALTGGTVTHAGIAAVFGLVVMVMIYAVGDVSGAHFNPAVSMGFWLAGRMPARSLPLYWGAQVVGAIAGSLAVWLIVPQAGTLGATAPSIPTPVAFLCEGLITFILMFVILSVAIGSKEVGTLAGVAIGGTVGLGAMFAGPLTGASMNAARSLGPALVSGNLDHLWIYLLAPALGAAVATLACVCTRSSECCPGPGGA